MAMFGAPSVESASSVTSVRLFGRVRVGESDPIKFQTRKTASLFAYLALHAGRDHSRARLIEELWPGEDPAHTKDRLNQALSWLRRNIPLAIVSDRQNVRLEAGAVSTDVEVFETLLKRAKTESDRHARQERLIEAMQLAPEPLLIELDDDWVFHARQRLSEVKVEALQELTGLLEASGQHEEAIVWANHLVDEDELEEESHYLLIHLYLVSGDTRKARHQYERLAEIMQRRLNLMPSLSLEDLQASEDHKASAKPLVRSPVAAPFVVPAPRDRFVGRFPELARIGELMASGGTRLVTITGPGGVGKTRLAIETALQFRSGSSNPAWFVSLAEIDHPRDLVNAILQVVGSDRKPGMAAIPQLIGELAMWKSPILILDNFEHLAEGGPIVAEMLSRSPGPRVIVTSRQRLNVAGEVELAIQPLSTDAADGLESESVRLFMDRAQLQHRQPPLSEREGDQIRQICSRLEGSPLAIEIAAAWSNTFTISEIIQRLDERLAFLVDRRRDIVPRHRSLRAAIDYSYQLLPVDLRQTFAALSVFRGGWTLEAASAVVPHEDVHLALTSLVDRSLVFVRTEGTTARYGMSDVIREFAAEHLSPSERAELEGRHAQYIGQFHHDLTQDVANQVPGVLMHTMEIESANTLAALQWCLRYEQGSLGLAICVAMARLWKARGPIEDGRAWVSRFLELPLTPHERARGLKDLGSMAWIQSDFDTARQAHEEALALFEQAGDGLGLVEAKFQLAIVAVRTGELELAESLLREVLDDPHTDAALRARSFLNLGNIYMNLSKRTEAKGYFERCLVLERARNNAERVSYTYNNLGLLAFLNGQYSLSTFYLEESIRYGAVSGTTSSPDVAYANLARIATRRGQFQRAGQYMAVAFEEFVKFGNKIYLRLAIVEYGLLLGKLGDLRRAAQCIAIADTLTADMQLPVMPAEAPVYEDVKAMIAEQLSPEEMAEIAEFVETQSLEDRLEWSQRLSEELAQAD